MRRPTPSAVDPGRYQQLARMMEHAPRRIVWVALQNRRRRLAEMRQARRDGYTWPDDPAHPVRREAADWQALAAYGRWLEQRPEQQEMAL